MVGAGAKASVFSFHPIKPITTLEGRAVLTNDKQIADFVRLIRSHGISKKSRWDSDASMLGYNYRLSDVACALGLSQLLELDKNIQKREQIARYYEACFKDCKWASTLAPKDDARSSWHLFELILHPHMHCLKQDLYDRLAQVGISTQVHYKPTYKFSLYRQKYGEIALKNAEEFYKAELSIPAHQLLSQDEIEFIASEVLKIGNELSKKSCGM